MDFTDILLIIITIIGFLILVFLGYLAYLLFSFLKTIRLAIENFNQIYNKFNKFGEIIAKVGEKKGRELLKKIRKK